MVNTRRQRNDNEGDLPARPIDNENGAGNQHDVPPESHRGSAAGTQGGVPPSGAGNQEGVPPAPSARSGASGSRPAGGSGGSHRGSGAVPPSLGAGGPATSARRSGFRSPSPEASSVSLAGPGERGRHLMSLATPHDRNAYLIAFEGRGYE